MPYCSQCASEYREGVTTCADCGGTEMISADELHRRGMRLPSDRDTRKFVRAGTAEDPLSADLYVGLLNEAQIPVFARPRRTGTVDGLTTASARPWWEILVPEEHAQRASALLAEERQRLEASAEDNAQAAEAEALEHPPSGPGEST